MAGTSFCAGVKGRLLVGQMSRFVRETLQINQANYLPWGTTYAWTRRLSPPASQLTTIGLSRNGDGEVMRRRHSPSPGAEMGLANGSAVCNLRRPHPLVLVKVVHT